MQSHFDVQGHRGARGLRPENTLPGFELAIDLGVHTIETDLHLTLDGVPILTHDPAITERLCRRLPGTRTPPPEDHPLVRSLSLEQVRTYQASRNPDPVRFPQQKQAVSPLALLMAAKWRIDPHAIPTLAELIAFADAYHGEPGRAVGKTDEQRARAGRLRFDLELKRVPFRPEWIGDGFDGENPALLETRVVEVLRSAGVMDRASVRSFDHRCVRAIRTLEPALSTAVLIAATAPVQPVDLARQAGAQNYCPDFTFLRREHVRECHEEGIRVVPWTVNSPDDMQRLLEWGVDGMTTDYPDRLVRLLGANA
jgi:glycerophosphoryl diester phosphodiesterase